MIPAEKAKELFEKYCKFLWYGVMIDPAPKYDLLRKRAAEAAIIAVDEIIEADRDVRWDDAANWKVNMDYWEEVKKELEKL